MNKCINKGCNHIFQAKAGVHIRCPMCDAGQVPRSPWIRLSSAVSICEPLEAVAK